MESGECLGRECVWAGVVLTSLFLTRARVAGVLFLESIEAFFTSQKVSYIAGTILYFDLGTHSLKA